VLHALFVVMHSTVLIAIGERIRRSAAAVENALGSMAARSAPAVEQGLAAIAAGDLTVVTQAEPVRIASFGSDEIGRMARMVNSLGQSFDSMLTHYDKARTGLSEMIENVQDATEELQMQGGGARDASYSLRSGARNVGEAIQQI